MNLFFKKKGLLIFIIALLLALSMAVVSVVLDGESSPVSNALGVVITPLQKGLGGVVDWIDSLYGYMYRYDKIEAENEQLRVQIAQMEEEARNSIAANEENERLRKLLGLSERRRDFEFESAEIVARGASNWASTFSIAKGSSHGIEPRDCVINEEGFMVGYVSEVGTNHATVTTIIDTDVEVGALIFRTHDVAVAEGDFELMQNGRLKLTYIPETTSLLNGDVVLTSGIGGLFPRDLVIGTVVEVRTESSGMAEYAILEPAVHLDELSQVFIIKSFEITE